MSYILFFLVWTLAMISFFMRSPWQYAIWLVPTAFFSGAAIAAFTGKKWLMMSLFLVFLGGVMTILLYISSLGSPCLFPAPKMLPYFFYSGLLMFFSPTFFFFPFWDSLSIIIFSNASISFLGFLGGLLLVVLLACVDRVEAFKGPLKSFSI